MKKKKAIPCRVRREIAMRHGCKPGEYTQVKCAYCNNIGNIYWHQTYSGRGFGWVSFSYLEMDHIIPEYLGGDSSPENIALACRRCNRRKGTKILNEWIGG